MGDFVAVYGELALERIDGEEAAFPRLAEALTSLPFLAGKKLVVLRRPSANKEFLEQFEALLGEVPETTSVIIVEPKLDKRLNYYKWLKKATDFRDFPPHDTNGLAKWLEAEAKAGGGQLSLNDARYLVERVGTDQQLLATELEKLLLYDAHISRATIDVLTEATPQSTIFQLLEAAFAGNSKQALKLYEQQRVLGAEPPQIIAMIAWQLHALAIVKTAGDRPAATIASAAKLSPFVVQKSQTIARRLSLAELKKLTSELLAIDVRSKSTNLDADDALQHYLLQLAQ